MPPSDSDLPFSSIGLGLAFMMTSIRATTTEGRAVVEARHTKTNSSASTLVKEIEKALTSKYVVPSWRTIWQRICRPLLKYIAYEHYRKNHAICTRDQRRRSVNEIVACFVMALIVYIGLLGGTSCLYRSSHMASFQNQVSQALELVERAEKIAAAEEKQFARSRSAYAPQSSTSSSWRRRWTQNKFKGSHSGTSCLIHTAHGNPKSTPHGLRALKER